MSQKQKLLDRLLSKPKDFTWSELKAVLGGFGYSEYTGGKTSGSSRKFVHDKLGPIMLHKPHPDETLKAYQVAQIITHLKVQKLI